MVDAAARALLAGRTTVTDAVDPHRLLGVSTSASEGDVRAAYLRIARVVHPDAGGTDELFRIVAAAHDTLTGAPDWATPASHRFTSEPPPPPPPPGPWRPPAEARPRPRGARLWLGLAMHAGVVGGAAVFLVVFGRALSGIAAVALSLVLGIGVAVLLRGTAVALVRTAIELAGTRLRVRPDSDPIEFLMDACLDAPVGREREDVLYDSYLRWCAVRRSRAIARWVFVERLRSVGLLFVKASAWQTGTWVGVRLR